ATMGTAAAPSNTAPLRTGRHSAAVMTSATTETMTITSPAITKPGLAKAFPAVTDCEAPPAVLSVNTSHDGAKAIAVPRPAIVASPGGAPGGAGRRPRGAEWAQPQRHQRARGARGPADQADHETSTDRRAASGRSAGHAGAQVGQEEAERDEA